MYNKFEERGDFQTTAGLKTDTTRKLAFEVNSDKLENYNKMV